MASNNQNQSGPSQHAATQSFLNFSEFKSDTVLMDNGNYLGVVAVSSTNFSLKNQDEQNAMIIGYQGFLNSLDFEIQVLMQSRSMDVSSYLEDMRKKMEQQSNELLRVQTGEYIEFISKLIENASIMSKSFYVIIAYNGALVTKSGGVGGFLKPKSTSQAAAQNAELFQENKLKLDQRVNTVISGLSGLGLRSARLTTEELIELFYNSYNFGAGQMLDASKISDITIDA